MITHIEIGPLIEPSYFDTALAVSMELPEFVHTYGTAMEVPSYPCWMTYSKEHGVEGAISFTRNTMKDPVLLDMVNAVAGALRPIFPSHVPPVRERIHLVRTVGDITSHVDEDGRLSCINIGLRNSETAITRMSTDGKFETFDTNHKDLRLADGNAYLINTGNPHSVIGSSTPRYLITYSFGLPFDRIKAFLRL